MTTAHVLLGLLTSGPSHGYDLKKRHDERFPEARPLAYGQVYSTLQRLVRDGLAEEDGTEAAGGPERTRYRITDAGSDKLKGWLAEVAPPAPFVSNEIFAKVVVAILAGDTAGPGPSPGPGRHPGPAAYLDAQRAAHLARMRELTTAKADPAAPLATVLSADYALSHLDADLRWMATTAQRLSTLEKEVRAS
ncbi:PadR family transcriptional regulator [Streptomyces sp. A7024]|uniref:PadR family transcriptional regulator n=1 Tax=Streptomyces coryli TaxID=1128680 RepID=A0A6G4UE72_9ACTN|nr:PadR family transcriptional regulator [Streptomyces coryli]NGN70060.1 PadR family transcriptional regulator [Streptomyces coryli]